MNSFKGKNGKECYYDISQVKEISINPHHTNFIFVDDGSFKDFGVEIDFRSELESQIKDCEGKTVPMVLFVVEGGAGTIETVKNAFKNKTPIILVQVNHILKNRNNEY